MLPHQTVVPTVWHRSVMFVADWVVIMLQISSREQMGSAWRQGVTGKLPLHGRRSLS